MRGFALVLLAGCYAPATPSGAPCSTACPGDEVCIEGTCRPPGEVPDAGGDAVSPGDDRDRDGVGDAIDLCPDEPDPEQLDEDSDGAGDVCDPCPVFAANADDDMDGVGNLCDPHPDVPGDAIVFFEGFADAPVGWNVVGNWTFADGRASVTVGVDERAFIAPPIAFDETGAAGTRVTPAVLHGIGPRAIGVTHPNDGNGSFVGVECEILRGTGSNTSRLGIITIATGGGNNTQFEWDVALPIDLMIIRANNAYDCVATGNGLAPEIVMASHGPNVPAPVISLRTRSISGSFDHLLVVDSP
jgi:hypothetical protein